MKKKKLYNDAVANNNLVNGLSGTCLCDDVIINILTRLPVKSLTRFRCVSKLWNSLILSPNFIAAHNKFQREEITSPRRCRRNLVYIPENPCYTCPFVTSSSSSTWRRMIKDVPNFTSHVIGSCEGLGCVQNRRKDLYIWNPLLQSSKILPQPPSSSLSLRSRLSLVGYSMDVYGFGYSYKDDDYRVIKITYGNYKVSPSYNKVDVYSLKSDLWRTVIRCNAPALVNSYPSAVFMDGCVVWWAPPNPRSSLSTTSTVCPSIIWFDVDKELFGRRRRGDLSPRGLNLSKILSKPDQLDKEVLRRAIIPKECCYKNDNEVLWKIRMAARENSSLSVLIKEAKVTKVMSFDGEFLLHTRSPDVITYLGLDIAETPWDTEHPSMLPQGFHVLPVSETLLFFDND